MKINGDFTQRVVVHSEGLAWQASPMKGVDRRPLDRVGGEVARATSIVRYASGSHFMPHVHTGGEEFLVLDGVFQDEHGDYPVGSYIRNPPQSRHKPGAEKGCVIFVKLWQFEPQDRTEVALNYLKTPSITCQEFAGVSEIPLHLDKHEKVSIMLMSAHSKVEFEASGGAELLVLAGNLTEQQDELGKFSWVRIPAGGRLQALAGPHGAKIWLKTGHLVKVEEQIERVMNV